MAKENKKRVNIIKIIIIAVIVIALLSIGFVVLTDSNKVRLADVANIGDYVAYNAGVWTQSEISNLTNKKLYTDAETLTFENPLQFGGFKAGDSRNKSIAYEGVSSGDLTGWKIIDINKETGVVTIVSTGVNEVFYYPGGENYGYIAEELLDSDRSIPYTSEEKIEVRDWSMYVNRRYATDASVLNRSYVDKLLGRVTMIGDDLKEYRVLANDCKYWLGTAYGNNLLWSVTGEGFVSGGNNYAYGIRVIVHLKPNIKVSAENGGTGTLVLPWKI